MKPSVYYLEEVPSFYLDKAAVRHKLLLFKLQFKTRQLKPSFYYLEEVPSFYFFYLDKAAVRHKLLLFKLQFKTRQLKPSFYYLEEVPSFYLDKAAVRHKLLSFKATKNKTVETLLLLPRGGALLLLRQSSCEAQTPVIQA